MQPQCKHPARHPAGPGRAGILCALVSIALFAAACAREPGAAAPVPSDSPSPTPALTQPPAAQPAILSALAGQAPSFRFDHLPPEAGLSQSVVLDFVQDDQGFLWLATQDGLNRYDGYEFKIFKDDPAAPGGLTGNFVSAIDLAPAGELWAGTLDGGLNRYDAHTGTFTAYLNDPRDPSSLSENAVSALDVDAAGVVWVGTSNRGLNRLDPRTGQVTRYLHDPEEESSLGGDNITSVVADLGGPIWVGTIGGGLNRLDPATGKFARFLNDPSDERSLSQNSVQSLYVDHEGVLWAGTFTGGLNRFDPKTGGFTHYRNDPDDPASLGHDSVASIYEDRAGRLWVGTQGGGLNLLERDAGHFTRFRNSPDDATSLSNDNVMAIFEDQSEILWLGTFGSGADYYDPYRSKFLHVRFDPGNPDGLSDSSLWSIYEDAKGVLWIGTNNGGLNRFDPATGAWRHYRHNPSDPTSLGSDTVYAVCQDRQGIFWLGTPAGLSRFDPVTEQFQAYPSPLILTIHEDRQGRLWLGSAMGLILFDRETGGTRFYTNDPQDPTSLSSNSINALFEDAQGNFWVGTGNGGLNRFDRETGRATRYVQDPNDPESLRSNLVLSIVETRDGVLWLGTSAGLNRFDPGSGAFLAFRERDGLPNDVIYGILEDDAGQLWLSTNRGIARFDPATRAVKIYNTADGLQGLEFNQWSYFRDREGVMYFGGVRGLNAFHPGLVRDNPFVPPIVITGFELYHRAVTVGPDSPLRQPIEVSDEIRLRYTDKFFEFTYAALHYSSPGEIRYAYVMEGLDEGWNEVGNRHFATYTNVPPGDYTFRVKGTNSDGVWNEQAATLRVVIPPPFWQTTWFRVLVAAAMIIAVFGGFALRIRSVERQRQRLEVQVTERTHELRETVLELARAKNAAEAASRAKSIFLANMSHEFRTPLNAILGFTQIMARDKRLPADHQQDLQIVHRSGEHLLGLINDVLEMSKIEAGRTTLTLRGFDLIEMLAGLGEMFALRATHKGIALEMELAPETPRYVRSDEGKLRQVLLNLMGNAVKFTQQGRVVLSVSAAAGSAKPETGERHPVSSVRFAVCDTGPGIPPEDLAQLFTPFVQSQVGQQTQEGTGLGLAISQQYVRLMGGEIEVKSDPGQGSVFSFKLPLETVSANDLEKRPPTRHVIGLAPGQPVYRMLLVDDQEVNRKLLVKIFEPVGFEVREASNGLEALQAWEAWEPHVIWMDMRMPVMDGYEATRRIKATTRGMATIIIALTASALEEDRAIILSEGCDDYLRKPLREEELFEAVARHLGVRYVYEDVGPAAASPGATTADAGSATTAAEDVDVLAARLRSADPIWQAELERAAILGDLESINRLAGQIAAQAPDLAETIAELARGFEHDRILAALRGARST